jgi:hypothetical protein
MKMDPAATERPTPQIHLEADRVSTAGHSSIGGDGPPIWPRGSGRRTSTVERAAEMAAWIDSTIGRGHAKQRQDWER